MSINEQSLGRSPPKMRATERGGKQAICVSIYDTRCIHSTPPRSLRTAAVVFPHVLPLSRLRSSGGSCSSPKFLHPFVQIEIGGRRVVVATGAWWCCMRGWRGCWQVGCWCLGGGLALHWGRGGGRVVGGVGVRAAALAPPFDRSDGAAVCWWWWSVWDGGWEAARRSSAARPATSLECGPPMAGGFHHDSGSRIVDETRL